MLENGDYNKNIDASIINLKDELGKANAKEELRRFAHHARNYEYSGTYASQNSKLLLKAEIIKSIFQLCGDNKMLEPIKTLLHNTFTTNLSLYDKTINQTKKSEIIADKISRLNIDNRFLILLIKSQEYCFSIIIEKIYEGIESKNLNFIGNILTKCCTSDMTRKDIYKALNGSLRQIKNCPIKIHCLDKNNSQNFFSSMLDRNKKSNIRIYNYFTGSINVGYSKQYETPKKISSFFTLNIIYAISYVLARKGFKIDLQHKKIIHCPTPNSVNDFFNTNVNNIIEYTVSRLADDDKYVIGAMERKFNLNYRIQNNPVDIRQININELDAKGLSNLKILIQNRISKVLKLQKYTENITNDKFDKFIESNERHIPQLILEQAKLIRAKYFFNKASKISKKKQSKYIIKLYDSVIELDPNFKEAYFCRGINYYNMSDYKNAIVDFTKALKVDPYYVEAYHYRGLSYAKIKQLHNAILDFKQAIEIDRISFAA